MTSEDRQYAMPKIGDVIAGKYRLEKVAGEGGMGIVYAAEHLVLKQRVAVKVLLPDAATSEAMVERFAREARAAAKINSEHVARVLDAGSLAGSGAPFLVMEYLEGCDLEELLDLQKTLPVLEVADYLVQALEGLAHAHAANIVHRDLKPANLFLGCRPDGTNAIKLLDFGISKTTKASPQDKRLTGHHVLGSPVYMSPEQLRNSADIDSRADIWSIGIVAYEMLAGVPPFDGEGVGEIFAAILEKEPVPLHEKNPKIPEAFSHIILKCLRRDPDERWADAGQLAAAVVPFSNDPQQQSALVERAEQVLARAKSMTALSTPLEAQKVIAAIDAVVNNNRSLTTGNKSYPPIPLRRVKHAHANANVTLPEGKLPRLAAFAKESPARVAIAALGLLSVLLLAGFVAIRATRSSSAATRVAAAAPVQTAPQTIAAVTPPPAAVATAPIADDDNTTSADVLMDLPTNPSAAAAVAMASTHRSPASRSDRSSSTRENDFSSVCRVASPSASR